MGPDWTVRVALKLGASTRTGGPGPPWAAVQAMQAVDFGRGAGQTETTKKVESCLSNGPRVSIPDEHRNAKGSRDDTGESVGATPRQHRKGTGSR